MTSFRGKSLAEARDREDVRYRYVPIYPSSPHPDNGSLLYLADGRILVKDSYVDISETYIVPAEHLRPYDGKRPDDVYRLCDESRNWLEEAVERYSQSANAPGARGQRNHRVEESTNNVDQGPVSDEGGDAPGDGSEDATKNDSEEALRGEIDGPVGDATQSSAIIHNGGSDRGSKEVVTIAGASGSNAEDTSPTIADNSGEPERSGLEPTWTGGANPVQYQQLGAINLSDDGSTSGDSTFEEYGGSSSSTGEGGAALEGEGRRNSSVPASSGNLCSLINNYENGRERDSGLVSHGDVDVPGPSYGRVAANHGNPKRNGRMDRKREKNRKKRERRKQRKMDTRLEDARAEQEPLPPLPWFSGIGGCIL